MIYQYLALLLTHWIADFVLQTHWQASNKSKNWNALFRHVATYTIILFFATSFIFAANEYKQWLMFIIINSVFHFATDAITSRVSSKLYAKQDFHNFFVVIGFDQLIHQVTLALTMLYFFV